MGGVWRLLRLATIAALLAAAGLAVTVYLFASRSLPSYSGERAAAGIRAPVEILRDRRAVPHIFAASERDAYFGLGYAHAQDRLWQMELGRRLAQGRLTEFAGNWGRRSGRAEQLLRLDVTARALDLPGRAERSLEVMAPETRALLAAYAAGVNAWLDEVDRESLGRGAPELLLLGAEVARWRAADSVAAFKLLAALRSTQSFDELARARFLTGLGPERVDDLFPAVSNAGLLFSAAAQVDGRLAEAGAVAPLLSGGDVWAAAGSRSATRAPLFASDPHLPYAAPSPWYMARLSFPREPGADAFDGFGGAQASERLDLIGATAPGVPAILYGRNTEVAWGAAELGADVADVYIEQLNPQDSTQYRTPEGWAPFKTREAQIPIGDGQAVTAVLRETRHGPVLPLDWPAVAGATPKGHVAALAWTALAEDDRSLEAALALSRSRDVLEALSATERHVAPPQTLLVVDRRSIALAAIGRVPLRRADSLSRGVRPSNGWSAENDWVGHIDPLDLPRAVDPPLGLLANADSRIPAEAFPRHLGQGWAAPYRLRRITKLLNNRQFHTLNGFQSMQNDTVSEMARAVLPLMAEQLWAEKARETGLRAAALERLSAWNGDMDAFLAEPLIFSAWAEALTRRLTEDDLGPLAPELTGARPQFLERVFLDRAGAGARWCDDGRTPERESCETMASLALDDALARLEGRYGGSIDSWRWGRSHQAAHRHQAFGDAPFFGAFLNILQETGGGDHTISRGALSGAGENPFANIAGGGFRAIYDFADLDRSVFAMAGGQSGHFLSRHYDDFAELWRTGDYAPLSLARQDAEAGSVGVLRLVPSAP